jgi:hypothetical protein
MEEDKEDKSDSKFLWRNEEQEQRESSGGKNKEAQEKERLGVSKALEEQMNLATDQLDKDSKEEEGTSTDSGKSSYDADEMTVSSRDHDLSLEFFDPEASEVSSGIFDALHGQKYEDPTSFLQTLWNVAGPSVASMLTQLDLIKTELNSEEAGVEPDFSQTDTRLIDFLIEEAGEDNASCITFVDKICRKLEKHKAQEEMDVEFVYTSSPERRPEEEALILKEGGGNPTASKTQGTPPRAPKESTAEDASNATNMEMSDGDKEGAQFPSMAQVG